MKLLLSPLAVSQPATRVNTFARTNKGIQMIMPDDKAAKTSV